MDQGGDPTKRDKYYQKEGGDHYYEVSNENRRPQQRNDKNNENRRETERGRSLERCDNDKHRKSHRQRSRRGRSPGRNSHHPLESGRRQNDRTRHMASHNQHRQIYREKEEAINMIQSERPFIQSGSSRLIKADKQPASYFDAEDESEEISISNKVLQYPKCETGIRLNVGCPPLDLSQPTSVITRAPPHMRREYGSGPMPSLHESMYETSMDPNQGIDYEEEVECDAGDDFQTVCNVYEVLSPAERIFVGEQLSERWKIYKQREEGQNGSGLNENHNENMFQNMSSNEVASYVAFEPILLNNFRLAVQTVSAHRTEDLPLQTGEEIIPLSPIINSPDKVDDQLLNVLMNDNDHLIRNEIHPSELEGDGAMGDCLPDITQDGRKKNALKQDVHQRRSNDQVNDLQGTGFLENANSILQLQLANETTPKKQFPGDKIMDDHDELDGNGGLKKVIYNDPDQNGEIEIKTKNEMVEPLQRGQPEADLRAAPELQIMGRKGPLSSCKNWRKYLNPSRKYAMYGLNPPNNPTEQAAYNTLGYLDPNVNIHQDGYNCNRENTSLIVDPVARQEAKEKAQQSSPNANNGKGMTLEQLFKMGPKSDNSSNNS